MKFNRFNYEIEFKGKGEDLTGGIQDSTNLSIYDILNNKNMYEILRHLNNSNNFTIMDPSNLEGQISSKEIKLKIPYYKYKSKYCYKIILEALNNTKSKIELYIDGIVPPKCEWQSIKDNISNINALRGSCIIFNTHAGSNFKKLIGNKIGNIDILYLNEHTSSSSFNGKEDSK